MAHATQLFMTLMIGTIIGLAFAWQIGKYATATMVVAPKLKLKLSRIVRACQLVRDLPMVD